ncbi:ssDNA endonuclease and repair protein rad10 [Microbotryomycetes sp. JL201]|nr:ssDNA endonuclease and repair protein rad10 [Microbotryomycetes sp. JL201]
MAQPPGSEPAADSTGPSLDAGPSRWQSASNVQQTAGTNRWQSMIASRAAATAAAAVPTPSTTSAPVASTSPSGNAASQRQQTQVNARPVHDSTQPSSTTPVVRRTTQLNSILVSTVQKGNPVITHIRNVPWEYSEIVSDYQVGATSGVLYLSLRYHLLHPEYIHVRIQRMGHSYALRIMLVLCDVDNHQAAIRELTKTAAEAAKYLEMYKQLERKAPDVIKERVDSSYISHLTSALTSIRGVNKTDVVTLASNFGTFKNIVSAPAETLMTLPGLGDKKVKRLRDAFESPFLVQQAQAKRRVQQSAARDAGEAGLNELN